MNMLREVLVIFLAFNIVSEAHKCSESQFWCNDGNCISSEMKCNGAIQCPDGSDEDFVTCRNEKCEGDQFQCVYGACVSRDATCDGIRDCFDNSDELLEECRDKTVYYNCLKEILNSNISSVLIAVKNCEGKEQCKDGTIMQKSQKCDGVKHCKDGSDETLEMCSSEKCLPGNFRCKYGACSDSSAMCDGIQNCADGSDELEQLCQNNNNLCVLPTLPENGHYTTEIFQNARSANIAEYAALNYSCQSGYKLIGNKILACFNGLWSDKFPKCVPQCLLNKHLSVEYFCLPNASHDLKKKCDGFVAEGTLVMPKCREPDYYYPEGLTPIMNCKDGKWDKIVTCSPQCGLALPSGVHLIIGGAINGRSAKLSEAPWHAGIYRKTTTPYMQICGGTIISSTVIISAAHCFWSEVKKLLPASYFAVAVGKLYRPWNNPRDEDAQRTDVREIKIPPRFQGAAANFQDDIAVVLVMKQLEFHRNRMPVCLDFDENLSQLSADDTGRLAGWGLTAEDGVAAPVLQLVELPYVDIEHCIADSPPEFIGYITSDKICAGFNNGTIRAVCRGDSGGGLAFPARDQPGRFYLRGVVSTAPSNDHLCNAHVYTAFTEIAKHEKFIKQYL